MRTRNYSLIHARLAVATLGIVCLTAGQASAAAITYNFSQNGWSDGAGDTAALTGSFTGTPQANGDVLLANLTSFQATLHETGTKGSNTFTFNLGNTTDFSYDPGIGLLDFAAGSAASNIQLCSGGPDVDAVCFGINPSSGVATPYQGFFDDLPNFGQTTTELDSTVTPAGTTAPEPANLSLLGVAGVALCGFGIVKRPRRGLKS
jgi:hypothetical protein